MHTLMSAPHIQHCYSLGLSDLLSQYPVPQCPPSPNVQYEMMYLVDLSIVRISCCICDASSVVVSFCLCISLKVTFLICSALTPSRLFHHCTKKNILKISTLLSVLFVGSKCKLSYTSLFSSL